MAITRRQFIKQSAGIASVGIFMPRVWLGDASGQERLSNSRRKLVVIQLAGGNDGLNTVIPYSDSRYYSLRPALSFKQTELKDELNRPTMISNELALHPAMKEIKDLYDAGRVAIVNGVGYPQPNLSHFLSMDVWHTANPSGVGGAGWLGKYADIALIGKQGISAASIGGALPKSLFANRSVIPNIQDFAFYNFVGDPGYPGDYGNQLNVFTAAAARGFDLGTFQSAINSTSFDAVKGAQQLQASVAGYSSSVTYPPENPLAAALKMASRIITTIPDASLLYVTLGGFDTHSDQIDHPGGQANKLTGQHASLVRWFSQAVKAFYDDMTEHGMADDVVIMEWSEFGRRPEENASFGTDHGTANPMFVIGNPVRGGIYGGQPSLNPVDLDAAGNIKFTVDFRSVYATVLDRWLETDSQGILGGRFENAGFLV